MEKPDLGIFCWEVIGWFTSNKIDISEVTFTRPPNSMANKSLRIGASITL